MKLAAAVLLCAACALPAGDPAGFYIWKSAELKGFAKTLAPKLNEHKVASDVIASYGNYRFQIAHRKKSAPLRERRIHRYIHNHRINGIIA